MSFLHVMPIIIIDIYLYVTSVVRDLQLQSRSHVKYCCCIHFWLFRTGDSSFYMPANEHWEATWSPIVLRPFASVGISYVIHNIQNIPQNLQCRSRFNHPAGGGECGEGDKRGPRLPLVTLKGEISRVINVSTVHPSIHSDCVMIVQVLTSLSDRR